MTLKLLFTAAAATLFAAGAAFAQTTSATGGKNAADFVTEQEERMFTENADLFGGFFTDETMTEMRSEEEMIAAWEGMDEEEQATVLSLCAEAMQDEDNYGDATRGTCGLVSEGR